MRTVSTIALMTGLLALAACASNSTTDNSQYPATSADDAPPGSIHNLPIPAAVQAAKDALAARLHIEARSILVLEALETEWSDSCLGLGGPAESCAAVMTPGYNVLMTYHGDEYRYRTNLDGSSVRAE